MKIPSKRMPSFLRRKLRLIEHLYLLLFLIAAIGVVYSFYASPIFWAGIGIFVLAGHISIIYWRRHIKKLAVLRKNENICNFAKSFDCRKVDTWIIRATYEELQKNLKDAMPLFPLRSTDRLEEDLDIDPEELDDIAYRIAERANYDMSETIKNPLYNKVNTVTDLVMFFTYQPKINNAEQHVAADVKAAS